MCDKKNIFINPKFYKKMLCNNIIKNNKCCYQSKCMYAHSLEEQKIDGIRKKAYEIIKSNYDLSHIDLQSNQLLYDALMCLTNVCAKCSNSSCPGGYNCKYGAINENYKICLSDLTTGECASQCNFIHLTKRGLKPFNKININNIEIHDYDSSSSSDLESMTISDDEMEINSIFKYKT